MGKVEERVGSLTGGSALPWRDLEPLPVWWSRRDCEIIKEKCEKFGCSIHLLDHIQDVWLEGIPCNT